MLSCIYMHLKGEVTIALYMYCKQGYALNICSVYSCHLTYADIYLDGYVAMGWFTFYLQAQFVELV